MTDEYNPSSMHNLQSRDEEGLAFKAGTTAPGTIRSHPEKRYQAPPTESAKATPQEDDDDKRPPNIEKCKIHQRAKRVYARVLESEKNQIKKVCGCCGNAYDLEKLGMCCSKSDFYHLGAGFPLYFEFIIFSAVLIMILMLFSGIYNIYTNLDNEDCSNNFILDRDNIQFCDSNWITRTSLVNKRFSVKELEISNWINLGTIVIMVFAFHFFRRQSTLTTQEVDNSQQTPGDYTVMLKNLPLDARDEEIKDFFEKELFFEKKVNIVKIIRGFNIGQFIKLQRRKNAIQLELGRNDVKNREKLERELDDVRRTIDVMEKNTSNALEPSPFAFVTFEQEEDAREALRRLAFSPKFKKIFFRLGCYSCFSDLKFRGEVKLNAHRAPEPSDIMWENLGASSFEQKKRRFISFVVCAFLILLCGGIIIAINVGKSKLSNPEDIENTNKQESRSFGTEVISVVIGLVIMVINNSLNFSIRILSAYESRSTWTSYFVSVARRLAFCTFVNSTITLLVTNYILNTLWKNGGLLNDVFVVYIINAGVGPLMSLFNPWYFWRLYKRRQIINQGEKCTLTQKEANLMFEGPPVDMAQMYAMIVKTLWTTAFFAPILPVSIPIPLINLFLTYWVDKYLLLNRFAKPTELSKGLSAWMTEYLEFTPFIFAAGNIIFRALIVSDDIGDLDVPVLPSILSLILGFVFIVIPFNPISKFCFKSDDLDGCKKTSYSEMRVEFNNDYDIANPIYHDDALESWLKAVEQAGKHDNETLRKIVKDEIGHEPGKNHLKNLKAYAKFAKGLDTGKNAINQPSGPNQAMMFYKVDPQAAKLGNFIMHPKLHIPQQTGPSGNTAQIGQYNMSVAANNRPGNVQLNFESNFNPNQQQSSLPQNQPYQQVGRPPYMPINQPPQYPPQHQGQPMQPNFVPQYPMNPQNQPFIPPHSNQPNFYPQNPQYGRSGQQVPMMQMMNNGVPTNQPGYGPNMPRYYPQN